ncbi:YidB family protein [Herminiimonas arsenitoxidans]|uniref:YidB family protein n=1 Tax=Herminiimonas arsenitoxidans TaxID=1809410 RepID=UPI000970CB89|nr:YidB family protein [Herminiimonas arsenitoxidans]
MGLLDQLTGQVMGSLGGQNSAGTQGDLMSSVMGLVNGAGGVQGLLEKLQNGGLGDQVASWIGTGENQPVSADQIKNALGEDNVQQIAQQAGIEPERASAGLAELLPQIIDKLTPNGQVPEGGDLLQQGLGMLKGKFFG